MFAYLHKTRSGYELTIVARPCAGEEFNSAKKISVNGKREANKICAENNYKPYNF